MRFRLAVGVAATMISAAAGVSSPAYAQLPVCPQPVPADAYYSTCIAGGRFAAARLLFDLAIDHVLKGDFDPVYRRPSDIFRTLAVGEAREKNAPLITFLDRLGMIALTKLDTTTGTLRLDVDGDAQRFDGAIHVGDPPTPFTLRLPDRLAGGYWRTPNVLQVAFWEGQRATLGIVVPGGKRVETEIECLVVSTDGIRVVTGGSGIPDLSVRFDECGD